MIVGCWLAGAGLSTSSGQAQGRLSSGTPRDDRGQAPSAEGSPARPPSGSPCLRRGRLCLRRNDPSAGSGRGRPPHPASPARGGRGGANPPRTPREGRGGGERGPSPRASGLAGGWAAFPLLGGLRAPPWGPVSAGTTAGVWYSVGAGFACVCLFIKVCMGGFFAGAPVPAVPALVGGPRAGSAGRARGFFLSPLVSMAAACACV